MTDTRHNSEKFPEIWAAFQRVKAEKAALMEERKPHVEAMNDLFAQIEEIKNKIEGLSKLAYKDKEKIYDLSRQEAQMARAMGAQTLAAQLPPVASGAFEEG